MPLVGKFEGWEVYEDHSGWNGNPCQNSFHCQGCSGAADHLRKMRKALPTSHYTQIFFHPDAVKKLLSEQAAKYATIGTGPWPDADDTGDPPSTKPMGWSLPKIGPTPGIDAWAPKKKSCGANCKRCKTFNEYAEPNQKDGSYVCYECR